MVFKDGVGPEVIDKQVDLIVKSGRDVTLCSKPDINPSSSYRLLGGKVVHSYYKEGGINVKLKLKVYPVQGNFH